MDELTVLELLNDVKTAIEAAANRTAREREERRKWYETTASEWLKKRVVVKWYQDPDGFGGEFLNRPTLQIHLVPGQSLQCERSAWAHEVGHGFANHGGGWTEERQKKSELMNDVFQSPELSKRLGIDVKSIYQAHFRERYNKQEQEADLIGEKLFHFYWPNDEYVPGNSTWHMMQTKFK